MKNKTIDLIALLILAVIAISFLVMAVAAVLIAHDIDAFVNGDAWDAPWLNVITRGPVQ